MARLVYNTDICSRVVTFIGKNGRIRAPAGEDMRQQNTIREYSVFEINQVLEELREQYDIVRLVDIEECRTLEVTGDGTIRHGNNCFSIWNREHRCSNCTSYRACMTHMEMDKMEHLGHDREQIHSVPIRLEMLNGEIEHCVIECVSFSGTEGEDYQEVRPEEYISVYDVLTRTFTQEKLFREIRQRLLDDPEETYLLLMCNIRNFSVINRLFGIERGNQLLIGIADMLRQHCSPATIYGRYRGDRFLLLLPKRKFDAAFLAERLEEARALMESPIFSVQMKMGVYEITNTGMSVSTMVDHADAAVNSIRNSKTEQIAWYSPDMLERKLKDRRIIAEFPEALRGGEFRIYLQPQIEMGAPVGGPDAGSGSESVVGSGTGADAGLGAGSGAESNARSGKDRIVGAEALVRWVRPGGEVHLPGEFIPVLHHSELLSHLDVYVWELAAQLLCRWKGTDFGDLYISVNADPTDFYYLDVPEILDGLCRKYAIDPSMLRLEITEETLAEDMERQGRIVDRLHALGFIVEIDDFGKGYSSLSLLKDIHADVLKIDMGFVQSEENADRSEVILESIIEMAENLHMGVITEGVETREQMERMAALGCREYQGFYLSRPVPVDDFELVVRGMR